MTQKIQDAIDTPKDNIYIIVTKNLEKFSIPEGSIEFNKDNFLISDSKSLIELAIQNFKNPEQRIFIKVKQINIYAQNALLKLFEDIRTNTHFYLVVPTKEILIDTLLSRCTVIKDDKTMTKLEKQKIIDFVKLSTANKLEYIENIYQTSKEEGHRNGIRTFLDDLEVYLHSKILKYLKKTVSLYLILYIKTDYVEQNTHCIFASICVVICLYMQEIKDLFLNLDKQLERVDSNLLDNYVGINEGQAIPSVLDVVMVDVYGAKTPLQQISSINREGAKSLLVSHYDVNQIILIEQAITNCKPRSISFLVLG